MRNNSTHNIRRLLSCIIMMVALAWLTVSIPFVYSQQQSIKKQIAANTPVTPEEECNVFGNTTEEKTSNGANTLSEYLHDAHQHVHYVPGLVKHSKCHPSNLYFAFHPELLSPPPEQALS